MNHVRAPCIEAQHMNVNDGERMNNLSAPNPATPSQKRKIAVFRESEGASLHDSGVMTNNNGEIANKGITRMFEAGLREGYELKCLYRSPEPDGFSLGYAWFKSNYALPPHTHNTDCLYYVIAGEVHFGNQVLTAGDGLFIPADAPYTYSVGPRGAEILEFRDSSRFDITVKDGTEQGWERLVSICAANKEQWRRESPPMRMPKVATGKL